MIGLEMGQAANNIFEYNVKLQTCQKLGADFIFPWYQQEEELGQFTIMSQPIKILIFFLGRLHFYFFWSSLFFLRSSSFLFF
jgi:hypothetical protein